MAAMTPEKFLECCRTTNLKLELNYDTWHIEIKGRGDARASAFGFLLKSPELEAGVIVKMAASDWLIKDWLTERAAIRGADGLPDDLYSAALVSAQDNYEA